MHDAALGRRIRLALDAGRQRAIKAAQKRHARTVLLVAALAKAYADRHKRALASLIAKKAGLSVRHTRRILDSLSSVSVSQAHDSGVEQTEIHHAKRA
jgi:hypothetical protein